MTLNELLAGRVIKNIEQHDGGHVQIDCTDGTQVTFDLEVIEDYRLGPPRQKLLEVMQEYDPDELFSQLDRINRTDMRINYLALMSFLRGEFDD